MVAGGAAKIRRAKVRDTCNLTIKTSGVEARCGAADSRYKITP
jgi:hypothetical protein